MVKTEIRQPNKIDRALAFAGRHKMGMVSLPFVGFGVDSLVTNDLPAAAAEAGIATIFLGADAIHHRRTEFKYSQNPGIILLQEQLGITFSPEPRKVEWTRRNRRVLANSINPYEVLAYERMFAADTTGVTLPEMNTIITRKDSSVITDAHESMHIFVSQINPDISTTDFRDPDIEKNIAYRSFDEGIATFASFLAAFGRYSDLEDAGTDVSSFHRMIESHLRDDIFDVVQEAPGNMEFAHLRPDDTGGLYLLKVLLHQALSVNREDRSARDQFLSLMKQANSLRTSIQYRVGVNFVDNAIPILYEADENMTISEALLWLIQHPPTTIEELTHPERFVQEKLGEGQQPQ